MCYYFDFVYVVVNRVKWMWIVIRIPCEPCPIPLSLCLSNSICLYFGPRFFMTPLLLRSLEWDLFLFKNRLNANLTLSINIMLEQFHFMTASMLSTKKRKETGTSSHTPYYVNSLSEAKSTFNLTAHFHYLVHFLCIDTSILIFISIKMVNAAYTLCRSAARIFFFTLTHFLFSSFASFLSFSYTYTVGCRIGIFTATIDSTQPRWSGIGWTRFSANVLFDSRFYQRACYPSVLL